MEADVRLADIVRQIRENKPVEPITVRHLLSWFGSQRRGSWTVQWIRSSLRKAGLQTEPDFESAYIDSPISFSLIPAITTAESVEADRKGELAASTTLSVSVSAELTVERTYADPTYRISKLAAANNKPVSVAPDETLQVAVALMLTNDFSQLPVMINEREVKGIITWTSIGTRLALGKNGLYVRDFMEPHQEMRINSSLFAAIPFIVQYQYVLIRGIDNRISGIVTASDLSLQFQLLAEPFLLLSEIENHIRYIVADRFTAEELASVRDPGDVSRQVTRVSDLSIGEYIRLLENPDRWKKLNLLFDRVTFCKQLDRVRNIRNDVMHFDPDGIPQEDLQHLRDFTLFLQRLQSIGITERKTIAQ